MQETFIVKGQIAGGKLLIHLVINGCLLASFLVLLVLSHACFYQSEVALKLGMGLGSGIGPARSDSSSPTQS